MFVTLLGIVTLLKPVLWNAFEPIATTPAGIVTLVKAPQPLKALELMTVTAELIVTLDKAEQPSNTLEPILDTELGITMFCSPVHPWNA